ncbi:MAG: hypothetical protein FJY67_08040 [Calditrichaeota bacterium]|nr:hypothetical protein [Calditrichota bacterium]
MLLCRCAGALVGSIDETVRAVLREAFEGGVSTSDLREIILTSYLFDGFPTALEGYRLLWEVLSTSELSQPASDVIRYSEDNLAHWRRRGEALCRAVYGEKYDPLMGQLAAIAPELLDAMIIEGYGKVLSRPNLPVVERELCVIAMLIIKNRPRQLLSHAIGALHLGASLTDLRNVVSAVAEFTSPSHIEAAVSLIANAASKHHTERTSAQISAGPF